MVNISRKDTKICAQIQHQREKIICRQDLLANQICSTFLLPHAVVTVWIGKVIRYNGRK